MCFDLATETMFVFTIFRNDIVRIGIIQNYYCRNFTGGMFLPSGFRESIRSTNLRVRGESHDLLSKVIE